MNEFKRVLSDAEIHDLFALDNDVFRADSDGNFYTQDDHYFVDTVDLFEVGRKLEQAVLAKQKPIGYLHANGISFLSSRRTTAEQARAEDYNTPIYAHPCPSPLSGNGGCLSESAKSERQKICNHRIADMRNEIIKTGYMCVDCGRLFQAAEPSNITKLSLSVDTKEAQALIQPYLDNLKDWQLVPKEPTDEMKLDAIYHALNATIISGYNWHDYMSDIYKIMLKAAPKHTGENNGS